MRDLTNKVFKRIVLTWLSGVVIACMLMTQGCTLDDQKEKELVDEITIDSNGDSVRVDSVIGTDGREYITSQYECIDDKARVTIEVEGHTLTNSIRQCSPSQLDYSMDYITYKLYEIKGDSGNVRMEIKAQSMGQLCNVGDVKLSFTDIDIESITAIGSINCGRWLAVVNIPSGEYRGIIEFIGYRDEYFRTEFRVNLNMVEAL